MSYKIKQVLDEKGRLHIGAYWYDSEESSWEVVLSSDGCISIKRPEFEKTGIFWYDGEIATLAKMVQQAHQENERRRKLEHEKCTEELRQEFAKSHTALGYPIDLNVEQTKQALAGEIRQTKTKGTWGTDAITELFYNGKWLTLGRTDLADDVATTIGCTSEQIFYRNPRKYFLNLVQFGARVTKDHFSVVDAVSDG